MPIAEEPKYELPPKGTHTALCYQHVDLGTQKIQFEGKPASFKPQIHLAWELSEEKMANGKPFSVSKDVSVVLGDKATLTHIAAASGVSQENKSIATAKILGRACNITIDHVPKATGGMKAAITAFTPLKKNEATPPAFNSPVNFDMIPGKVDWAILDTLPDFLKKKIMASPEYAELRGIGKAVQPEENSTSDAENAFDNTTPPFEV